MDLTLNVVSYRDGPPTRPGTLKVGVRGASIGRSPDNDLVLPDTERFVSGVHARIEYADGDYYLTDLSANGTFVNGSAQAVGRGCRVPLHNGDSLAMGDYVLRVVLAAQASGWEAPSMPPGVPGPSPGGDSGRVPVGAPGLTSSDDFDLLGQGLAEPWRGTVPDHLPEERSAYTPPPAIPEGWDLLHDQPPAAPPPGPVSPPPAPAPGVPLDALFQGLGLAPAVLSEAEIERLLHGAGELLRTVTEGLMRLLAARTEFKRELRLETTTLQPLHNNPLKFAAGAPEALRQLLLAQEPGFLPPTEAAAEALDDVLAHEAALLAGLKAALHGLLQRFDPAALERRFQGGGLGGLLPGGGKARYWEQFKQVHAEVARDAEEGFLQLFAQELNRAYEAQVLQIKGARRGLPG
jgi:type VI secretion system protein